MVRARSRVILPEKTASCTSLGAAALLVSAASLASGAVGALDAFQRILNCLTYPVVGMVA